MKKKLNLKKKFHKWFSWKELVIAITIFFLISIFGKVPFYPCKTAPVIQHPVYLWKLCNMNILNKERIVGIYELYFGTQQYGLFIALFINLTLSFLLTFLIFYIYRELGGSKTGKPICAKKTCSKDYKMPVKKKDIFIKRFKKRI